MSARSRRACLLTVLGAGGRCSGARVGPVMAGVGPHWRKIGGQEDARGDVRCLIDQSCTMQFKDLSNYLKA